MSIEQIGDEGKVEFGISSYEGGRGQKLAAIEGIGILKHLFGALQKVSLLEGSAGANIRSKLVEEYGIVFAILYITREVGDTEKLARVRAWLGCGR